MATDALRKRLTGGGVVPDKPTDYRSDLAKSAGVSQTLRDRLAEVRERNRQRVRDGMEGPEEPSAALVKMVREGFREAHSHKHALGEQCNQDNAYMACDAVYTPEERKKFGNNEKYFPLTGMMVRRMQAFLRDTLSDDRDRPRFDFIATSVPEVPDYVVDSLSDLLVEELRTLYLSGVQLSEADLQEALSVYSRRLFEQAQDAADRALRYTKEQVFDKVDESNYSEAADDAILDMCICGTGILYGPERVVKPTPSYAGRPNATAPKWRDEKRWNWRTFDPRRFFPSPCSTNGNDGEAWYYVDYMSRRELYEARRCAGWLPDNIELVLKESAESVCSWVGSLVGSDERLGHGGSSSRIEVLWRSGWVQGQLLLEMGMSRIDGNKIDADGFYDTRIRLVGDVPIEIVCTIDPEGSRALHKFELFKKPARFWGVGVAKLIESQQAMINASFRSIARNMAYSSSPIFEIDEGLLTDSKSVNDIIPGMIIPKDSSETGLAGTALVTHAIPTHSATFLGLLREMLEYSELTLGLPRFLSGSGSLGGAASTATGLNRLQANTVMNLRSVIINIDEGLTQSAMGLLYRLCVVDNEDPDLATDAKVVTLGASAMLARQANRDGLFAQLGALLPFIQAGFFPVDLVDQLIRELARHMGLDPKHLPDRQRDQLEQLQLQQQLSAAGGIAGGVAGAAQNGGTGNFGANTAAQQSGGAQGGLAAAAQGAQLPQAPQVG